MTSRPSRRDFIKLAGLGLGSLAIPFRPPETVARLPQFPQGDRLGRVAVTPNFYSTALRSQPTEGAPTIRAVGQDEVVVWLRDVVGTNVAGRSNRRWAQTPEGFIYAADLQPTRSISNTPVTAIPGGKGGFCRALPPNTTFDNPMPR